MHKVFVYGTLKKDFYNNYILQDAAKGSAKLLFNGVTKDPYPLVVATPYNIPFLLDQKGSGNLIQGEVYEVDEKMLAILDELEANGRLYQRTPIPVKNPNETDFVLCETYLLPDFAEEMLQKPLLSSYEGSLYIAPNERPQESVISMVKKTG